MNFLEERIMKDGVVKEGNILKSSDGCQAFQADGRRI